MAGISQLTNLSQQQYSQSISGEQSMRQTYSPVFQADTSKAEALAGDITKLVKGIENYRQVKHDLSIDATKMLAKDHKIAYIQARESIINNVDLSEEEKQTYLAEAHLNLQNASSEFLKEDVNKQKIYDEIFTDNVKISFAKDMATLDKSIYERELSKVNIATNELASIGSATTPKELEDSGRQLVKENKTTYGEIYTKNIKAIKSEIESEASQSEINGVAFETKFISKNGLSLNTKYVKEYLQSKFKNYVEIAKNGKFVLKKDLKLEGFENEVIKNEILSALDVHLNRANSAIASNKETLTTLNGVKSTADIIENTFEAKKAEEAMKNGTATTSDVELGYKALQKNIEILKSNGGKPDKIKKAELALTDFTNLNDAIASVQNILTKGGITDFNNYTENGYPLKNKDGKLLYTLKPEVVTKIRDNYINAQEQIYKKNPNAEQANKLKIVSQNLNTKPVMQKKTEELFNSDSTVRLTSIADIDAKLTLLRQYDKENPEAKNQFLLGGLGRISQQYKNEKYDEETAISEANKFISKYRTGIDIIKVNGSTAESIIKKYNDDYNVFSEIKATPTTIRTLVLKAAREGNAIETEEETLNYAKSNLIPIADEGTVAGRSLTPWMDYVSTVIPMPYSDGKEVFSTSQKTMGRFFDSFIKKYNSEYATDIDYGEIKATSQLDPSSGQPYMTVNIDDGKEIRDLMYTGQDVYDILEGKKDILTKQAINKKAK